VLRPGVGCQKRMAPIRTAQICNRTCSTLSEEAAACTQNKRAPPAWRGRGDRGHADETTRPSNRERTSAAPTPSDSFSEQAGEAGGAWRQAAFPSTGEQRSSNAPQDEALACAEVQSGNQHLDGVRRAARLFTSMAATRNSASRKFGVGTPPATDPRASSTAAKNERLRVIHVCVAISLHPTAILATSKEIERNLNAASSVTHPIIRIDASNLFPRSFGAFIPQFGCHHPFHFRRPPSCSDAPEAEFGRASRCHRLAANVTDHPPLVISSRQAIHLGDS